MAVVPIRNVRRALKSPPPVMEPAAAEGLRTRIKAVELEAERLQQEALYGLAQTEPPGPAGAVEDRGGAGQRQLLSGRHRSVSAGAARRRAFGICKVRTARGHVRKPASDIDASLGIAAHGIDQ